MILGSGALAQSPTPQVLTVCDALERLESLNGEQVQIRGRWSVSDIGQSIVPLDFCKAPTIRDGWIWRDVIQLSPLNGEANEAIKEYRRLRQGLKSLTDPKPECIEATVSGLLETREHFKLTGSPFPLIFNYYVARLTYRRVTDIEIVRYPVELLERDREWSLRPQARRIRK